MACDCEIAAHGLDAGKAWIVDAVLRTLLPRLHAAVVLLPSALVVLAIPGDIFYILSPFGVAVHDSDHSLIACSYYRGLMLSMNSCTRGQRSGDSRFLSSSAHSVQQSHTTIDSRRRLIRMQGSLLRLAFFFSFIVVVIYFLAPLAFMVHHGTHIQQQEAHHK